jgi:hypothetical protein
MGLGIVNNYVKSANTAFTSSAALLTVGLSSPIAANQTQHLRWWVPITVGATGGVRAQVVPPAGGTIFILGYMVVNTVAPSITPGAQTASAAFTSALANAGTHYLEIEATIVNGTTAGTVDLQMAQNTSDALTLTVLRGASLQAVIN